MLGFPFHLPQTIQMLKAIPHLCHSVMIDVCIEKMRNLFCNKYNPYRVQRKKQYVNKTDGENKSFAEFPIFHGRKLCKTKTSCFPSDESG